MRRIGCFLRCDLVDVLHDGIGQLFAAVAIDRRNNKVARVFAEFLEEGCNFFVAVFQQVDLVQYQPARFFIQRFVVFSQFIQYGACFMHGIDAFVHRRNIHNVQQKAGAGQMAQELVAQSVAFSRAFNQAGYVGDDEAFFRRDSDYTQIGVQRGERVVGHLGARGRNGADKGGFARVRHTQQAHIGEYLEFQL